MQETVRTVVYEPSEDASVSRVPAGGDVPAMTSGRAVLVGRVDRYLAGLMAPSGSMREAYHSVAMKESVLEDAAAHRLADAGWIPKSSGKVAGAAP